METISSQWHLLGSSDCYLSSPLFQQVNGEQEALLCAPHTTVLRSMSPIKVIIHCISFNISLDSASYSAIEATQAYGIEEPFEAEVQTKVAVLIQTKL